MTTPIHRADPSSEVYAMSISDASRVLGIGRTKTYSLIKEGQLSAFKIGRRTLIRVSSIHALITDTWEQADEQ